MTPFTSSFRRVFRNFPIGFFLLKWLLLSVAVGVPVGCASAFFLVSLDWATNWREAHPAIIWLLPVGGFVVGCLYHYLGRDVESGTNLLLENIHRPSQVIPFKMAPFVLFGTIVTHLFGGSAGREGTALQMGGSIADQFTRLLRLRPRDRKLLLISGIAAGFGSVFGTPLAGTVFALEVLRTGQLRYTGLFPALASAIFADLTVRAWHVGHVGYRIAFVAELSVVNVIWAVVAGIAFGATAVIFSSMTHAVGGFFKNKIAFPPFRPVVGGILVAVLVYISGTTKYIGLGIPTIVDSFTTPLPYYDFALKILFTALTLGAAFKGGEVTPLFFVGATLGNALALFIPLPLGLLAGMGFVAVFAGAANTPLACTLMAIELFGSECAVFAAIACVTAYFISGHRGIYGSQIIGEPKHFLQTRHRETRIATPGKRPDSDAKQRL